MTKSWYRKRDIAHWLLSQLITQKFEIVKENIKIKPLPSGGVELDETSGDDVYSYQYLSCNLRDLSKRNSKYTLKELNDAKDILLINKHIWITSSKDKDVYDVSFSTNNEGRIAYEDGYYSMQKSEQRNKEITNVSNWLTPIMTFIVAVLALIISITQCRKNVTAKIITAAIKGDTIKSAIIPIRHSNHQLDSLHLKDSGW